jgi:hypothetical protein
MTPLDDALQRIPINRIGVAGHAALDFRFEI